MEGDEADAGGSAPEHAGEGRSRDVAPGQVWIACARCRSSVQLADAVRTHDGHVCPRCAHGA